MLVVGQVWIGLKNYNKNSKKALLGIVKKIYSNFGNNFISEDLPITNKVLLMNNFDDW